jgi:hypothetical protein
LSYGPFFGGTATTGATRPDYVPSILATGLRTDAVEWGILDRWGEELEKHWSDDFYGRRPVYLLMEPQIPANYNWHRERGEGYETPVLLSVDARGLRLLPDLVTFQNPHYVLVQEDGICWWDEWGDTDCDADSLPREFAPFAERNGKVLYSRLMTDAARTAIAFTKTAAVLADVPASRIAEFSGDG